MIITGYMKANCYRAFAQRARRGGLAAALSAASFLALFASGAARAEEVSGGQRVAAFSKPAVVRVLDGYVGAFYWPSKNKVYEVGVVGSGSGFLINPNGYIATNAHVTELTHEGEEKGREALFDEFVTALARDYHDDPQAVTANRQTMDYIAREARFLLPRFKHIHHVILPDGTSMPFEIKASGAPVGEGKDVAILKIELKNAPVLMLGDPERLQLLDPVMVVGYPAAADTFDSGILDAKSALQASITDGKLSARKRATDGTPILQISAPATHGSSGGPVLNARGEVVGILTFGGDRVKDQEVSGFVFVVPASTVMEYVKQAGIGNEEGLVDQRYREGLELFWGNHYSAAISRFEEVRRLFPQHSETDDLIRSSQEGISRGRDVPVKDAGLKFGFGMTTMVRILLGLGFMGFLAVVGAGALCFALLRRRPKVAAPAPRSAWEGRETRVSPARQSAAWQSADRQPASAESRGAAPLRAAASEGANVASAGAPRGGTW
jgi:serine protease Do